MEDTTVVVVSYSGKEINAKLVYYGAGLSGKTTNLESIYEAVPEASRGKMVSMKTQSDRTLFFDLLPLDLGEIMGFKTRFLLYTVPGQVFYNATRKLVLKGADAIVFVADSEVGKMDENKESLANLRANLSEYGLNIDDIPWVIQYNKRDLPTVYSVEELNKELNVGGKVPTFDAVATQGKGVFETFRGISHMLMEKVTRELRRAPTSGGSRPSRADDALNQPVVSSSTNPLLGMLQDPIDARIAATSGAGAGASASPTTPPTPPATSPSAAPPAMTPVAASSDPPQVPVSAAPAAAPPGISAPLPGPRAVIPAPVTASLPGPSPATLPGPKASTPAPAAPPATMNPQTVVAPYGRDLQLTRSSLPDEIRPAMDVSKVSPAPGVTPTSPGFSAPPAISRPVSLGGIEQGYDLGPQVATTTPERPSLSQPPAIQTARVAHGSTASAGPSGESQELVIPVSLPRGATRELVLRIILTEEA